MILADQDDPSPKHLAEDHLVDLGRLQRVGNEDLKIVAPTDDVNPLAAELLDDVLDPTPPDTDTGTDTVNAGIRTDDRNLTAVSGLT